MRGVYERLILERPGAAVALLLVVLAVLGYHARDFRLDASVDSLLLEDDRDLEILRAVNERYETRDFLILTFTPRAELFSDTALAQLRELHDELQQLPSVGSIVTILDVPLTASSDVPLTQLAGDLPTLESPSVDRGRAREELTTSPVYRDLVISRDARTTALLINLVVDEQVLALLSEQNRLRTARREGRLDAPGRLQLAQVSSEYRVARAALVDRRHDEIAAVRAIIDRHRDQGELHLGGVPMIADDMISFVGNDLVVFGSGVLLFVVIVLTAIFREVRWVVLPLASCAYTAISMIGLLGWIGWDVTVVSSNFLALMLIVTISMNIHLAVRYRQLQGENPAADQRELVANTLAKMVWPCLYTALTTIIGFGSLVFSGIQPVRDFGWMMSVGLAVAFATSFSLFPALLTLLGKPRVVRPQGDSVPLTAALARITERHGGAILVGSALLAVTSGVGISMLTVENSFISYFREDTEIYQGMKLIDEKLGGTTPLQVLLDFDVGETYAETDVASGGVGGEGDDELDIWDIDVASGPEYWFTPYKIERIKAAHEFLDGLPEVGKVLSLASTIRVAEALNDGKPFDGLELSLLYKRLPDVIRKPLVDPYFSFAENEARIQLRIVDSMTGLRRAELLERIETGLQEQVGFDADQLTVTGALVLYNNVLQSLFASQIASLGAVMLGIAAMLLVLFRSVPLAVIGIVPNLLAALSILGLMGLVGIPLDLMTITVAAITIGIAVDNAIHYIYRFREEFEQNGDYLETLRICHGNIGRAVLYTSATIVFGFSILALSNFFPTIYFGALTALAMSIAFLAALTLLPKLILIWRPF